MLSGRGQVRSWSQTFSALEFGLSSSELAASGQELAGLRPALDLSATDSVIKFGLYEIEIYIYEKSA